LRFACPLSRRGQLEKSIVKRFWVEYCELAGPPPGMIQANVNSAANTAAANNTANNTTNNTTNSPGDRTS
jgi:hypothetical protein